MKNETGSANSVFPHRRKTVGTKVHAFASPLINVGKCRIFLNKKGKKSPDYQHSKWEKGRSCFVSQLFCLGLSERRI